jgi:hypothetical protein
VSEIPVKRGYRCLICQHCTIFWNVCGEVSTQVLLVFICVWFWVVPGPHSGEV